MAISQSGKTAVTLEAIKLAKAQGACNFALCNVYNGSIVREVEKAILLWAGIEKGVVSTKGFSAQLTNFWLLSLYWGQAKGRLRGEALEKEMKHGPIALSDAKFFTIALMARSHSVREDQEQCGGVV